MNSLAAEIQQISEDANKSVNYNIGEKLAAFMRQQENENLPNFVLSGVVIHAAAKIFGRKVDYLEQEILGIAKNFKQIDVQSNDDNKQDENGTKEVNKKSRTKKYTIKDSVNLDKIEFEEKPINIVLKVDINKTLAEPSKISRLQKMKEFYTKNKIRSGKLAIPKSMLINEYTVSNFGSTQIHDYDDYKDIVGSRRDFASFSFYLSGCSGELQNDLNFSTKQSASSNEDYNLSDHDLISPHEESRMAIDDHQIHNELTPPPTPKSPMFEDISGKVTPIDFSLNIDEGIEMDDDRSSLLLPIQPVIRLNDILRQSPNLFPSSIQMNDTIDLTFNRSVLTVIDELKNNVCDFKLPETFKDDVSDSRMKNIFMIPLKKLKHKCLFDLPDKDFRELKRRKMDQHKSTANEVPATKVNRVFKTLDMKRLALMSNAIKADEDFENIPFLGFTKEQQNESLLTILYKSKSSKAAATANITESNQPRKASNDSGFDSRCETLDDDSFAQDETDGSQQEDCTKSTIENNLSGTDSCYNSLTSGQSSEKNNLNVSSFLEDFTAISNNNGNSTTNEDELNVSEKEDQSLLESEERIKQMKQSAINVAKWREFLKPILADSEKRSKIDMHEYGLTVIQKIGNVNQSKTFNEVVEEGKTPAYFLTMLQLINNGNISVNFAQQRNINEPTALNDIKITLNSKVVHKEKFDEMGQQFQEEEENKKLNTNLKRKGLTAKVQTSTPAKRLMMDESLSFNVTPNSSQSVLHNTLNVNCMRMLSQASSGYFSQNSTFSDF